MRALYRTISLAEPRAWHGPYASLGRLATFDYVLDRRRMHRVLEVVPVRHQLRLAVHRRSILVRR